MALIYISDLTPHFKTNLLEDIQQIPNGSISSGDTIRKYPILSDVLDHSLATLRLYLANFYDWNRLSFTGSTYVMFDLMTIHIFLYELYQRVSTNVIPTSIQANYSDTMQQLKDISMRRLFPDDFPQKNITYDSTTTVLLNSSKFKVNNRQY
jgi:hypothetical protein